MAYSSAVSARLVLVRLHQGYAAILLSSIHEIRQYLGLTRPEAQVSPFKGMVILFSPWLRNRLTRKGLDSQVIG